MNLYELVSCYPENCRADMVSNSEIWRHAVLLFEQHGRDALNVAGEHGIKMHEAGDNEGEAFWCKIIDALQELSRVKRDTDETEQ